MEYYNKNIKEVMEEFNSSESGLASDKIKRKLKKYGFNELKKKKKINALKIFLRQFKSFIIYILIAAVIISLIAKENVDAVVISIILIINTILGFIQEYKAEKAIEALKKLVTFNVKVKRNNKLEEIDAKEIVPGDILVVEAGDKIAADARLIKTYNLETQEASLTGESTPVVKTSNRLTGKLIVADKKNILFSGTNISKGKGEAIVIGTGMNTEIGKIAEMIQEDGKETPLQKSLQILGKKIGMVVVIIAVIVFVAGVLRNGTNIPEMLLISVALAVAAVPEGLPAVVTICLALGVQRMVKKNALVRRLHSVETLGSTSVICTDKTGTLTKNEMTVKEVFVNNKIIHVKGVGYKTQGDFLYNNKKINVEEVQLLTKIGLLCNDSELEDSEVIGDPTEAALIVSAEKSGLHKNLKNKIKRINEIPFDSKRKRMTTVHLISNKKIAFMKGAPDVLLKLCNRININGKIKRLDEKEKEKILKINNQFADNALRVLGFAYKEVKEKVKEEDFIFTGLQGMIDPPRSEVVESIKKCKKAGIRVIMITGDHKNTAVAIGNRIGLKGKAITGEEIDKIDLDKIVEDVNIYARVNPEHKVKILEALKKKDYVVAMTGDGVNDAPALKKSDIGIGMSITGTEVAKESSDMLLLDDNFASIVNAVEEGRGIYDNIKKFVEYMLSTNLGEVLTIFIAIMVGLPLPLIAIQILWINLLTDGFPALALSVDPVEKGVMERKPRKKSEKIIPRSTAVRMLFVGVIMMAGTLFVFDKFLPDVPYARTMAFSTLMVFQMFHVLNVRVKHSAFKRLFNNKWLLFAILSSILLKIVVIYTPLNVYFKTVPLLAVHWLYVVGIASIVLWFSEILKLFKKWS